MQKWIEDLVHVLRSIHEDIDPILTGKYNGEIAEDLIESVVNDRITPSVKVYSTNNYITVALNGTTTTVATYVIDPLADREDIKSFKCANALNGEGLGVNVNLTYYGAQTNIFFDARYFQKKIINLSSDETIYFVKNLKYAIYNIINTNVVYKTMLNEKAINILTMSSLFAVIKELNVPILMKYIYEEFRNATVDAIDALFDNYDVENHVFKKQPWMVPKV